MTPRRAPTPGGTPGAGAGTAPGDPGTGGAPRPSRVVVLLCGPPGAGKTTAARASGLHVYDRDDPHWPGEREFTAAIGQLATDRTARAVVIRTAATASARAKAAALVGATHVYVLTAPQDELMRRVAHRGRADRVRTVAGIRRWLEDFDRADGVQDFPGWPVALASAQLGVTSTDW